MQGMKNSIRGNFYKILHSRILWVHVLLPALAILAFCAYYSYSPWTEAEKVQAYIQMIAMVFPLMISIVVTMLYEVDMQAGGFANLLSVPFTKNIAHMGNLCSILLLGFGATFYVIVGFGCVFRGMGFAELSLLGYVEFSLIMFGANTAVYLLQYIICYEFGKGVSLGLGMIGTLLSPLLCMGIGDAIWRYVPCSYGIRLSTYFFQTKYNIINEIAAKDYESGRIMVIAVTMLAAVMFLCWGHFWQKTGQLGE